MCWVAEVRCGVAQAVPLTLLLCAARAGPIAALLDLNSCIVPRSQGRSRCSATSYTTSSGRESGSPLASAATFLSPVRCGDLKQGARPSSPHLCKMCTTVLCSDLRRINHVLQEWLGALNVDTSGLLLSGDVPTPRAWQILEDDGRRTQVQTQAAHPLKPAPAAVAALLAA